MSDEREPPTTDRPTPDADFEWLGFHLGVHFHPQIKLTARDAHEFSAELTDHCEIDHVNLESDGWTLTSTRHSFRVAITQSQLELHCTSPEERQERYDVYYRRVVGCFENRFHPQIVLASKAMVHGLMDIDGDARTFLARHVFRISPTRLDPLDRPIHALGMRLFFPSFRMEQEDGEQSGCDWDVDVRLESWMADPRKLFVEADASWDEPKPWNEESLEDVFGRLQTVSEYVKTTIRGFLTFQDHEDEE